VQENEKSGEGNMPLFSMTLQRSRRPLVCAILALLAACVLPNRAWADNFPSRPIKLIVGPSPDVFSRIIGEQLQQAWGQPVVVEPRPGGGGKLAAAAVASAEPDGHTLLFATPTYTLNAAMKLASNDLVKDFEAVSLIGLISYALVVHPGLGANSVADLVALAKARPGKLNCGSAGIGTVAASRLRDPEQVRRREHRACALSRRECCDDGNGRRHRRHVRRRVDDRAFADSIRHRARARRDHGATFDPAAGPADHGRIRLSGFRNAGMGRVSRARRHAQGGRAEAQCRDRPRGAQARGTVGMETPPTLAPAEVADFIRNDVARWTALVDAVGLDKLRDGAPP
jgi:hypothetical protein